MLKTLPRLWAVLFAVLLGACAQPLAFEPLNTAEADAVSAETLNPDERSLTTGLRLISARSRSVNLGSAVRVLVAEGTVEVTNVSPVKQVLVHGSFNGGAWTDSPAYYQSTRPDGVEIWAWSVTLAEESFDLPAANREFRFALTLKADTRQWWDNNGGLDYRVGTEGWPLIIPRVALGSQAVRLETAHYGSVYPAGTVLSTSLVLKNLAFAKTVTLVYTTDAWATVKTAPAYYEADLGAGLERWQASPVISAYLRGSGAQTWAESVEFCLAYTVNGRTYWDNNGGANYRLNAGSWWD